MSDWEDEIETPDVKAWKEEARALQQNMFLRLGDREWDEWDRLDITILYRKVGFGLYPLPKNNLNPKYTKKQFKNIKFVADVILENAKSSSAMYFACIFIFGKIKDDQFFIPVFKVKGKQNQTLFVDTNRHIYKKWQDYLNSNRLPKCMYCYPRDGLYQGEENQVLIDFGTSPACDPKSGILSIDGTTT
ncbi:unnamed protein product [Larinioides sclopetarius]|uniref:DUF4781 domain-containing protein n=1 Tax=Larinioides sclopetarius TaxID=280406 RepID=A0AAV2A4L0_9ARAC